VSDERDRRVARESVGGTLRRKTSALDGGEGGDGSSLQLLLRRSKGTLLNEAGFTPWESTAHTLSLGHVKTPPHWIPAVAISQYRRIAAAVCASTRRCGVFGHLKPGFLVLRQQLFLTSSSHHSLLTS
jgi:hypothetical protein